MTASSRIVLLLALGLLGPALLWPAVGHTQDPPPEAKSTPGMDALERSDPDAAVAEYRTAIENSDEESRARAEAQLGLGVSLAKLGRYDEATEALDAARVLLMELDDKAMLGVVWYQIGMLEQQHAMPSRARQAFSLAARQFEEVDEIDGSDATARRWRAAALTRLGAAVRSEDPAKAADVFDEAGDLYDRVQDPLHEADARYRQGLAYWDLREWDNASEAFEDALELYRTGDDPRWSAISQTALGRLRLAQRQFDDAQRRFDLALNRLSMLPAAAPYELAAQQGLAESLLGLNRYEDALSAFERSAEMATRLDELPFVAAATIGQARALEALDKRAEAEALYNELLATLQGKGGAEVRVQAYVGLGRIAAGQGRHADALAAFDEANTLNAVVGDRSLGITIDLGRGFALLEAGKYADADDLLAAAADMLPPGESPERAQLLAGRGAIAVARQEYGEAHDFLEDAIDIFEELDNELALGRAHRKDADAYMAEDDGRRAERALEKAVLALKDAGAHGEEADARALLANHLAVRGKEDDAIEQWIAAAELFTALESPSRAGLAHLAMARIHLAEDDEKEALTAATHAAELLAGKESPGPDLVEAWVTVAMIHAADDELSKAATHARKVLEAAPALGLEREEAQARLILGRALLAEGKSDEARPELRQALPTLEKLEDMEAIGDALFALGRIEAEAGEPSAEETLDRAKEAFKDAGAYGKASDVRSAIRDLD